MRLKSGSNVHSAPVVGHLKKRPNIYSKAVEEEEIKKPKMPNIASFSDAIPISGAGVSLFKY